MTSKQIHIEKYDFDDFQKEQKPFVMILSNVIQTLPPDRAHEFTLWVYLESLPQTWKPNKQHLMDHFQISSKTYERRMEWLNRVKLIEYRQGRSESGLFSKGQLIVLNGTRFNVDAASYGTVKIDGTVVNKKKPKVIHREGDHGIAKFDYSVESQIAHTTKGLSRSSPNRQFTEVPSNDAHINTTKILNKEKKKTNNPVSVFSDIYSVKTHIQRIIGNRKVYVEDDVIDQGIYYAFETNEDKSFDSVNKRINIFLKMVREGKWLIPQGFKGITSQSIRETEEAQEKKKREQYQEDAQAFRNVVSTVQSGKPYISMAERLAAYQESLIANQGRVPENNIQSRA